MKTNLVVTDLARSGPNEVSIVGYTDKQECIRLVKPNAGISESFIFRKDELVIFPFAAVELVLLDSMIHPPFTEDHSFDQMSLRFLYKEINREQVLYWSMFDNVSAIFEQEIFPDPDFHVLPGCGPRSIGTMKPYRIIRVLYEKSASNRFEYSLVFMDQTRQTYRLEIRDLIWRNYCDYLRDQQIDPKKIGEDLTDRLKNLRVYLRIGLDRQWQRYPNRCFLRVTSVHTIPDYFQGLSLANLVIKH